MLLKGEGSMNGRMRSSFWVFLTIALLSVSCGTGSNGGNEALENYAEEPQVDYDAPGFVDQTFDFSMTASVEDNQGISDSIDSDWAGTFIIDEDGIIHGSGAATYQAVIYNVEDGCGYRWVEDGGFDFDITGEALQRGDGITFWFVLDLTTDVTAVRGNPEATCDDPGSWRTETPDIYFDLHRDSLISDIQGGLHSLKNDIQISQTLEREVGGVSYTILVDLPVESLSE